MDMNSNIAEHEKHKGRSKCGSSISIHLIQLISNTYLAPEQELLSNFHFKNNICLPCTKRRKLFTCFFHKHSVFQSEARICLSF